MHVIVIASYLLAAAAFLAVTALLAAGWRGQRTGALLIVATGISMFWGLFLAWGEWRHGLGANWLMLAEVLRYGAWLVFVGALFGSWAMTGLLRGVRVAAQALWIVLALYCIVPVFGLALFHVDVALVGVLLLALTGLVFLEQIQRNIAPEQRWAVKFLLISLGVMFAYDIFLYSYALLYHEFEANSWAARGFVYALAAPLLLVAAARNRNWSLDVGVSRGAVFYSTSVMVVACYIIATAIGGYYVRVYGGDWGKVAEIALICFALLVGLLLASSGRARSRLRVFLHKNFFSFRHDYRNEWLRLTATLGASDSDTELPQRAVHALAQTMDSPAGVLFMHDEAGGFVVRAESSMSTPAGLRLDADEPAFRLMREEQWIYELGGAPPRGDPALRAPAALARLPEAWLVVPLVLEARLVGFVVLAQARAKRKLDWEDLDLLRTAGSQVAGTLVQAANAHRLAEARQFEGFNRLTAFLMHDLKNVAAQQSLLLQNASRHKHNPAFVDDMLETVDNSVQRIRRLLEQLRGGATPATRARLRLGAVIDKALQRCRAHAPAPAWQVPDGEFWIEADGEELGAALEHLVRNAQDATTADGHVTVRLARDGAHAVVRIEDDGEGMDEPFIRERLFRPFFTTKASKGMGIGAYQAREYIRSLGGALSVASTPGSGSVFTLRLPLSASAAEAAPAPAMRATP